MGMSKYDRMLFILNILRSRRNLTAGNLASECGVTERSIYRDIISLSEANIPIYFDHGYKLASNNFLPPLNFSYDEYNCLKMALDSTPLGNTEKYQPVIRKIRAKVDAGLSGAVKEKHKFTPRTTYIEIPLTEVLENQPEIFSKIENAITNDLKIEIEYDSIQSGLSSRIVDPYFIMFRGRAFYYVAYCNKTKELRTFRIDRTKSVKVTDTRFKRRQGVNANTYFEGSWSVFLGETVEVTIMFTGTAAKLVDSSSHHPAETKKRYRDGRLKYSVNTRGIEEIRRWILSYGNEAEVIKPLSLRNELCKLGKQLSAKYKN